MDDDEPEHFLDFLDEMEERALRVQQDAGDDTEANDAALMEVHLSVEREDEAGGWEGALWTAWQRRWQARVQMQALVTMNGMMKRGCMMTFVSQTLRPCPDAAEAVMLDSLIVHYYRQHGDAPDHHALKRELESCGYQVDGGRVLGAAPATFDIFCVLVKGHRDGAPADNPRAREELRREYVHIFPG